MAHIRYDHCECEDTDKASCIQHLAQDTVGVRVSSEESIDTGTECKELPFIAMNVGYVW